MKSSHLPAVHCFNHRRFSPFCNDMKISWKWSNFTDLTCVELYGILALRQDVFVVEQNCPYLDCDGLDNNAHHLAGWAETGGLIQPVAYLRVMDLQDARTQPSIGRVATGRQVRGRGIGRELMARGISFIEELHPDAHIRISAQYYLVRFYESLGFQISSERYLEDNIPHIEMTR